MKELLKQYRILIDKKYLSGLTEQETIELELLGKQIDAALTELKQSETYRMIFSLLRDDLIANKTAEEPRPVSEIFTTCRHLLREYILEEGWTIEEYYCQGKASPNWGWTALGQFPNYSGMNEIGNELGKIIGE